jgi:hypothetical protein
MGGWKGKREQQLQECHPQQNLQSLLHGLNVTPVDVYYRRDLEILDRREQIKQKTMLLRRKQNRTLWLAEKAGKVYMGAETLS